MYEPRLLTALEALADAFERPGVRYALIGGVAVSLRGHARTTNDLDFVVEVPQLALPGLLADLAGRGFNVDEVAATAEFVRHHMIAFDFQGVRIDWIKPVLDAYRHVLDEATLSPGFGRPVRVASIEGLVLLKLLAARPRDWNDIIALLDGNRGRLDLAWVEREWATVLPADDPRYTRFRLLVADHYERPDSVV